MKFTLQELVVLGEVLKSVPGRTPNRLDTIVEFTSAILSDVGRINQNLIEVNVDCEIERFVISRACIDAVKWHVPLINEIVYKYDGSSLCPTIVMPTNITCCGKNIKILGRHATMKLYDIDIVRELRSYHGKCAKCKKSYYHGYCEDENGRRQFQPNWEVLMFTSGMAFSKRFMKYMDSMICVGGTSFERATNVYNHNTEGCRAPLNDERLEAAWFVYRILQYVNVFPIWPRKPKSKELDIEELCRVTYATIKEQIDSKWMEHVCDDVGCKNRVVVIDGNEKLYRFVCGIEKVRVIGNVGEVNRYEQCIRNPVKGNKSTQPMKYCQEHAGNKCSTTSEQLDIRPVTRLYAKSISNTITSEEGCKKPDAINRFFDRTAGMFYVFRPCGIRLSHSEMYTCESCSDVFIHLLDSFGLEPDPKYIRLIAYDRACDLHPFIARLSREGNAAAKFYEALDFVVDGFHVKKHTEEKCNINSNACIYHPDLPRYDQYKGMNTEIAEQSFNRLNMFKYSTRKMTYSRRLVFLKFLDDTVNTIIDGKNR